MLTVKMNFSSQKKHISGKAKDVNFNIGKWICIEKCTPHPTQKNPLGIGKYLYKKKKKKGRKDKEESQMCSQETHMKNKPYLMEYRIKKKYTQRV